MSDNNTEALAQAVVKRTEVLVRKNILEFELRALLGTGMTADDIASFVKDVLQKIESESTVKFDAPVATPKQIETVTEDPLKIEDISASKVAELEAKVRALEYQVKLYRAKEELKARATEKNTTSKLNPVLSSTAPLAANNSVPAPPAGVVESHTLKRKAGIHEHHQIEATVSRRPRGIPVPRVQRGSRGRGNNRGGPPSPRRGSSASAATVVDKDSSSDFPSFPWFG